MLRWANSSPRELYSSPQRPLSIANFEEAAIGCIEADRSDHRSVGKHLTRSTCVFLHRRWLSEEMVHVWKEKNDNVYEIKLHFILVGSIFESSRNFQLFHPDIVKKFIRCYENFHQLIISGDELLFINILDIRSFSEDFSTGMMIFFDSFFGFQSPGGV